MIKKYLKYFIVIQLIQITASMKEEPKIDSINCSSDNKVLTSDQNSSENKPHVTLGFFAKLALYFNPSGNFISRAFNKFFNWLNFWLNRLFSNANNNSNNNLESEENYIEGVNIEAINFRVMDNATEEEGKAKVILLQEPLQEKSSQEKPSQEQRLITEKNKIMQLGLDMLDQRLYEAEEKIRLEAAQKALKK